MNQILKNQLSKRLGLCTSLPRNVVLTSSITSSSSIVVTDLFTCCEVVTWHHLHTRPSQYGCGYGLELVWIRASLQDFAYIDSYPYPTR